MTLNNAVTLEAAIKALNEIQQKGSFEFSKTSVGWDADQLAYAIRDFLNNDLHINCICEELPNWKVRITLQQLTVPIHEKLPWE